MSNSSLAEIYFIAAMMLLIVVGCAVAVFFFVRTFKREKAERQTELEKKQRQKTAEKAVEYVEK